MASAEEQQLQRLLKEWENESKDQEDFRSWFLGKFKGNPNCCSLENFAIYFLHMMRQSTEIHLRSNESETPKCQTPVRMLKTQPTTTKPTATTVVPAIKTLTPKCLLSTQSPTKSISSPLDDLVEMQLNFNESGSIQVAAGDRSSGASSTKNSSFDRSFPQSLQSTTSSTPVRRTPNQQHENQHQFQQQSRRSMPGFSTPQSNERSNHHRPSSGSGLCLGDFLVANTSNHNRSKKKSTQHNNSHHDTSTTTTPTTSKPKKRVVPTTISTRTSAKIATADSNTPFGSAQSSFSNENNLLKLSNLEIVDKNQCAVLEARKSLKLNANEISRELVEQRTRSRAVNDISQLHLECQTNDYNSSEYWQPPTLDISKLTNQSTLENLAAIYVLIVDLNLTPNILSELAYVLQLLNATPASSNQNSSVLGTEVELTGSSQLTLLNDSKNCVYFASKVLQNQQQQLALLDLKSLGVVLNNERISLLPNDLLSFLELAYQRKQLLSTQQKTQLDISLRLESGFKNVYYQHDKDSRANFPSNNEFGAFKTQRDLFYKSFKLWESNHLHPTWNFSNELMPTIREIFRQSEHPVNMGHFAKLFVAQLLISGSDATSPEELGVEMDLQKFSKLEQRLVQPSNFSVDYQFPRSQAYFRDFINVCGSIAFLEQLKLSLYAQLIGLNESSFEQLQLLNSEITLEDDESAVEQSDNNIFIVRPEVLASMLILSKFLGFVTALPYSQHVDNNSVISMSISQQQLHLRSLFQPNFDTYTLLEAAISTGKLLITLPWLVQYFAMLDNITLQLRSCTETLQFIFAIYTRLGLEDAASLPSTAFIVRCCIGWLLETKCNIIEQYYNYRAVTNTLENNECTNARQKNQDRLISVFIASLLKTRNKPIVEGTASAQSVDTLHLNPLLESILNIACPFLAEFRVAIMPSKYAMTKCASRTGRYRHITTRFAELTSSSSQSPTANQYNINDVGEMKIKKEQTILIEAFLHSQHTSMRRLIEFIIERTYKAVVKDLQHQILLPSKSAADNKVNALASNIHNEVLKSVKQIYGDARQDALRQWRDKLPAMIDPRIEKSLEMLLPAATSAIIKKTYHFLIKRNTEQKIAQWLHANMFRSNFYCSDMHEMTQKICKANKQARQATSSSELRICADAPSVSDTIDDLQYWLHCTSMRVDLMTYTAADELKTFLMRVPFTFTHTLPTVFYRLLGVGIVQLFQHLISRHPVYVTTELIAAACGIWLKPDMLKIAKSQISDTTTVPGIFDSLIKVNFIESLGSHHPSFEKLELLLIVMIESSVINVDFVNELFLMIFKEHWQQDVWSEISLVLSNIVAETGTVKCNENKNSERTYFDEHVDAEDEAKSHLFMEVLADLSRDIDF